MSTHQQRVEAFTNAIAEEYGAFEIHPHYAATLFRDKAFKGLFPDWSKTDEKPLGPIMRAVCHAIHREKAPAHIAEKDTQIEQLQGFATRFIVGAGVESVIANCNGKSQRIRAVMAFTSAAGVPADAIRFSTGGTPLTAGQALDLPADEMLIFLHARREHLGTLRDRARTVLSQKLG